MRGSLTDRFCCHASYVWYVRGLPLPTPRVFKRWTPFAPPLSGGHDCSSAVTDEFPRWSEFKRVFVLLALRGRTRWLVGFTAMEAMHTVPELGIPSCQHVLRCPLVSHGARD